MRTRWRSVRDIIGFVAVREAVYVAATVAMIVSLATLVPGWPRWASALLGAVGLALGLQAFYRDTRHLARRWSTWEFRELRPAFPADAVPADPLLAEVAVLDRGVVAHDPALDDALTRTPVALRVLPDPYELPSSLKRIAPYVLRRSTSARWPFNGPCVRLDSDLTADGVSAGVEARCRRVSFFDTLCSNELTGWAITREGVPWDFRSEHLLDRVGQLLPLAQSPLANAIGISTLAITSDDHLLLTLQSASSSASSRLWAPSGSGSLEPRDLDGAASLTAAVLRGMERELGEECALRDADVLGSQLLGYGRWLDRGAKPEFYAVTWLAVTVEEALGRRHWQRDEKLWTQRVSSVQLRESALEAPVSRWQDLLVEPGAVVGSASVPLEMCLRALCRVGVRRPDWASAEAAAGARGPSDRVDGERS